jgi:hypothetical protein
MIAFVAGWSSGPQNVAPLQSIKHLTTAARAMLWIRFHDQLDALGWLSSFRRSTRHPARGVALGGEMLAVVRRRAREVQSRYDGFGLPLRRPGTRSAKRPGNRS